jgi:hypothetical protein
MISASLIHRRRSPWPGAWRRRRGFTEFRRIRRIQASFLDFAGFRQDFTGITVDGSPESLLRAFWEKVSELKEIETLGGGQLRKLKLWWLN